MSRAGIKAGRAYVEIGADLKQLEKGLRKAQKLVMGFGKGMTVVGASMTGIGVAAGAALAPAIKAAANWENTIFRANQIFGDSAKAQISWADQTAKHYGRSRSEVLNFVTSVSLMYKNLGVEANKANNIAKTLAERALLFANVSGTTATEMMTRFIRALSGSAEVLDQFGVNLKEARLKNIQELMGYNTSEMNEYTKALARYKGLLDDTAVSLGAADPGTFIHKQQVLNSELERFSEELGGGMLESLGSLLQALNGMAQHASGAVGGMKNLGNVIVGSLLGLIAAGVAFKAVGLALMVIAGTGGKVIGVFSGLEKMYAKMGVGLTKSTKAMKQFGAQALKTGRLAAQKFQEGYVAHTTYRQAGRRIQKRPRIATGVRTPKSLLEMIHTGRQTTSAEILGPLQLTETAKRGRMSAGRAGGITAGLRNSMKAFTMGGQKGTQSLIRTITKGLGKGGPAALAIETMFILWDTGVNSAKAGIDTLRTSMSYLADVGANMPVFAQILGAGGPEAVTVWDTFGQQGLAVIQKLGRDVYHAFWDALQAAAQSFIDLLAYGFRDLRDILKSIFDHPLLNKLIDLSFKGLGVFGGDEMRGQFDWLTEGISPKWQKELSNNIFEGQMGAAQGRRHGVVGAWQAENDRIAKLQRDRAENEARRQAVIDRTEANKRKAKEVSERKKEDRKITEKYGQEFTEAFRKKEADAGKKPTAMERAKMMYDENMSKRRAWEEKRRSLQERLTSIKENKPDVSRAIASLGSQVAQKQIRQNKDVQKQIRDYNKDTADATKEIAEHMKKKGAAYSL